jgi:hypothetical protein
MEEEIYSFDDYFKEVLTRVSNLSDKEKDTLSSLKTSVEGRLLSKILGPELTSISLVIDSKPKRGLAAR